METRLSSKGQLVIPKAIREAMALESGDILMINIVDGKIVIEQCPKASSIEALYARCADVDLLAQLEQEHLQEMARG